jgi:hypothetical protein
MFKGDSWCVPTVGMLYQSQFNLHYYTIPFLSHPSIFNSFQNISLHPLPSQVLFIMIFFVGYSVLDDFLISFSVC